ncbi:hypothetical protein FRB91_002261, partial [Serendipita sp. 411]
ELEARDECQEDTEEEGNKIESAVTNKKGREELTNEHRPFPELSERDGNDVKEGRPKQMCK